MKRLAFLCSAFLLLASAIAHAEANARIPVTFDLDKAGYVTLVIEDSQGRRVNNLIADTFFEAGTHTVYWDGYNVGEKLDKKDNFDTRRELVKPGEYTVRGLAHDELALSYQVSIQSPGSPPWHTPDRTGGWLADHTPPVDCLYLPNGSPYGDQPQVMVSAPTGEAGHSTIWLDLDGNKLFGAKIRGWNSGNVNASDEGNNALPDYYAYALIRGDLFGLRRDITDGIMYDRLAQIKGPEPPKDGMHWLKRTAISDMAIRNGILATTYAESNVILLADLNRDRDKQFGTIEFDDPRGLTYDAQGRLYMTSGGRILRFDKPDLGNAKLGEAVVLVKGLDEPGRVRIGPNGELVVTVLGKRHQVLVYDQAGKLLRTIGKPGGLQLGWYDEQRMARPSGIAVDARGMLWVAEASYAPKRVSRWNFESGAFDHAWYGPPKYGGGGHIDPRDPTRFYYSSGLQGIEFKLDWKNDTSKPRAIYWRRDLVPGRAPDSSIYTNGRHYMINTFFGPAYYATGSVDVYVFDEQAGVVKRLAHVGRPPGEDSEELLGAPLAEHPELREWLENVGWQGNHKGRFMIWSDANLDGVPQVAELQFINFREHPGRWDLPSVTLGKDFTIATSDGVVIPAPQFNGAGVPVWDLSKWKNVATERRDHLSDVFVAADGTFISTMGRYVGQRVVRGYKNDELIWHINGYKQGQIAEHPGQLINAQRHIGFPFTPEKGEGGQMFILNGYMGSLYLVTTDGLIVTDLGGDERTKPTLSYPKAYRGLIVKDVTFKAEHFWPASVQMENGTIYVMAGKESSSVFELIGTESIRRIAPQPLSVSAEQLAGMADLKVIPGELRREEKTAKIARPDAAPKLDGDLTEWQDADWMTIDTRVSAQGAVMVRGDTLYAAWRTNDPNLLKNNGADGWQYIFATGGGLDIMLRTDFDAPRGRRAGRHSTVVEGDLRLFVTRIGDPVNGPLRAVRFQQVGGPGEPVNFTSPVGAVQFDSVTDVSDRIQIARKNGNFELAVPLAVLGIDKIEPGTSTLGDIGILIGDGSDTKARMYWNNKAAQMTTDIPTEARLMPNEWGTWKF